MDDAAMGIEHLAPVRDDIFTIGRAELTVVEPLTCQAAVHAASDQLAGLLSDAERGALEDHLAGCDSCSCLMDQLREWSALTTISSRPRHTAPWTQRVPSSIRSTLVSSPSSTSTGRHSARPSSSSTYPRARRTTPHPSPVRGPPASTRCSPRSCP